VAVGTLVFVGVKVAVAEGTGVAVAGECRCAVFPGDAGGPGHQGGQQPSGRSLHQPAAGRGGDHTGYGDCFTGWGDAKELKPGMVI
jgi:hypothetical protein